VTSKPDFKVMILLLVFMQLTRDLFAIAKFLFMSLRFYWYIVGVTYCPCNPGRTMCCMRFMYSCIAIISCVRINDDDDDNANPNYKSIIL